MRHIVDARRGVCLVTVLLAVVASVAAAPLPSWPHDSGRRDDPRHEIPITSRFTADLHGAVTGIGNSVVTCDEALDVHRVDGAAPCVQARRGEGKGIYSNNYQMTYRPVTAASLVLPAGSRVVYARLYWGGTYGMDSPNGPGLLTDQQINRISLKAPGDTVYRVVTADAAIGRMRGEVAYGYQTSADVTGIVAAAGPGTYTAAGLGVVATPYSWGSWTLVVAYDNSAEPLRRVRLWDGYRTVDADTSPVPLTLDRLTNDTGGRPSATLGYLSYGGGRTLTGDHADVRSPHGLPLPIGDARHPYDDLMNSTAAGFPRTPDDVNTFGWDTAQFDVTAALWPDDTALTVTFAAGDDGYMVGAVWTAVGLSAR